jgi:hypothetical protein
MLKQLNKWLEVQKTCRVLEAKSDRLLADMGIDRNDIQIRARGLDPADPASLDTMLDRVLQALTASMAGTIEKRRIRREHSAYRGAELA